MNFFLAALFIANVETAPLKVLICLDGVPLTMMERLKTEGHFKAFREPAPLISTFPAITEVMLTEFFGVDQPPGYGLRYYDKDSNVLRGGLSDPSAISIWFSLYDFVTPMIDRGLTYLWGRWGTIDIDYAERLLDRADGEILMIHLDSTDALMHNEPARVTERWLRKFDEMLAKFLEKNPGAEVVLFSDHGNDMTKPKRLGVEEHLEAKGFEPGSVVRGESGVAILPTGLISTSYMYTDRPRAVAEALLGLEGVDFALYRSENAVHIVGARGRAVVEKRGQEYRYTAIDGDPLDLKKFIGDGEDFLSNEEWFRRTLDHTYPDVLHRAWGGLTGHVENVGDVLLSLEDGYHCGSKFLSMIVSFHGTHGSLRKKSITGFLMSTTVELPPLRAEQALDHLGWRAVVARAAATRNVTVPSVPQLSCLGCVSHRRGAALALLR